MVLMLKTAAGSSTFSMLVASAPLTYRLQELRSADMEVSINEGPEHRPQYTTICITRFQKRGRCLFGSPHIASGKLHQPDTPVPWWLRTFSITGFAAIYVPRPPSVPVLRVLVPLFGGT